ncbi:hypothetical protein OQA88_7744 [Cercophora sp. LCS_1]
MSKAALTVRILVDDCSPTIQLVFRDEKYSKSYPKRHVLGLDRVGIDSIRLDQPGSFGIRYGDVESAKEMYQCQSKPWCKLFRYDAGKQTVWIKRAFTEDDIREFFPLSSGDEDESGDASGKTKETQLQLADTAIDRYKLLPDDKDFVFDHNTAVFPMANRKTFPALVGSGISLAIAEIQPCGFASLHLHPRSAEIFTVLSGRVLTSTVPESGVVDTTGKQRVISTELTGNMTTIFPLGSLHMQFNPECTPALAVAAFASEDPGAGLVAPETFALDDEYVVDTFGGSIAGDYVERVRKAIPQGAFFEVEACLKKCGL